MDERTILLLLKTIDIVAAGVELTPELLARKNEYVARIEAMVREGRGPTDAEVDELLAEGDALTSSIRDAVERKRRATQGTE